MNKLNNNEINETYKLDLNIDPDNDNSDVNFNYTLNF